MKTKITTLLLAGLLAFPLLGSTPEPLAVKQNIDLLESLKKGEMEFNINPKYEVADSADQIFKLTKDGLLISGKGYGYMATKASYKDYHLVVEFKFTGPTYGKRVDRARDSGILVHGHGPHGALGGTWLASFEAQIIEGGMGDMLVLPATLPDGTVIESTAEMEFELDRDKERRWKKGAPRQLVTKGRVNWEKRDEDWEDKVNFRGKDDPDAPIGEWNRLEVIAKGDYLQYIFNGKVVNEAFAVKPASGSIAIQTEAAELIVRKYELKPLAE